MSQSIVSHSDLTAITRSGNLGLSTTDSGTDFNLNINGSINDVGNFGPGTIRCGPGNTVPFYKIVGQVDWAGLVVKIPDSAQITKIRMICTVNWSFSSSFSAPNSGPNVNAYNGTVNTGGGIGVYATNSIYTESGKNDLTGADSSSSGGFISPINISCATFHADVFVDKTWDFGVILPDGLPYITEPDLEASFTEVKIQLLNTLSTIGGAFGAVTFSVSGSATEDKTFIGSVVLVSTLWEMIIDYEEGWTITSVLPDPAAPGDLVTITGDNLQNIPLTPDPTVQYTDDADNPRIVTIPNATLVDNHHITFTVPAATGPGSPPYYPPTVTIYSGTTPITPLNVYNATGSGIYSIVKDKRNDTLYDRATGSTTDVAIPEPFGETSFTGG